MITLDRTSELILRKINYNLEQIKIIIYYV